MLIIQTDALIRRPIDEAFFGFDYVGAPWPHIPPQLHNHEGKGGNGGFSLRRVKRMQELVTKKPVTDLNEDNWFVLHLGKLLFK